jgi:hypothetical protein
MRRTSVISAAVLLVATAFAGLASAAGSRAPLACFDQADWRAWSTTDGQTVYLRVKTQDIYRVDLPTPINDLLASSALLSMSRGADGSSHVCAPIDLNMRVSNAGSVRSLGVSSLRKLSVEEVAAIPIEALPTRYGRASAFRD